MPSTIPYDPSLVLTSVVSKEAITAVEAIAAEQAKADAAQDKLNSLLACRHSLDMTMKELLNLNMTKSQLNSLGTKFTAQLKEFDDRIVSSAKEYADAKILAETTIGPLKAKIRTVHANVESPVDYLKTQIKTMPLAADSINMDVQYFSHDMNAQESSSLASSVGAFVSGSITYFGNSIAAQMSAQAQKQVSNQTSKHSIAGTLVISVSCTHKNASILAPLVIDVDKGIRVWNQLFPKDTIVATDRESMSKVSNQVETVSEGAAAVSEVNKFSIISGTTFGSSFVGMVHVLNTSTTTASQTMTSLVASLQAQMDGGGWFENASGGFGVNASIANDVKNLLSSQNISSHVTLICMGTIPSIVASEVKMGVEKFATFDPKASLDAIVSIQNATAAEHATLQASADAARTGNQMVSLKAGDIKASLSALAEIDDGANKMLDINSMMTALDDYLKKAAEGTSGIPINYYLKEITKGMLAEMWIRKYFPVKEEQGNEEEEDDKEKGKEKEEQVENGDKKDEAKASDGAVEGEEEDNKQKEAANQGDGPQEVDNVDIESEEARKASQEEEARRHQEERRAAMRREQEAKRAKKKALWEQKMKKREEEEEARRNEAEIREKEEQMMLAAMQEEEEMLAAIRAKEWVHTTLLPQHVQ